MKISTSLLEAAALCHQAIDLSVGFSYGTVCDELPYSYLLKKNAVFEMLQNSDPLYLSHQTKFLDNILQTTTIHRGGGCLASVLYTTPIYIDHDVQHHDNFFSLVLSHQTQSERNTLNEIVAVVPNRLNGVIYGMNYLRAGMLIREAARQLETISDKTHHLVNEHAKHLIESAEYQRLRYADDISQAYIALETLAHQTPYFAHLYYESLTQVIMLSSRDALTAELALKGEFNARSFYDVLLAYGIPAGDRYDTSQFAPSYETLQELLQTLNEQGKTVLDIPQTLLLTLRAIRDFLDSFGTQDRFQTELAGQCYLFDLSDDQRVAVLRAFSCAVQDYRQAHDIDIVINSATLKQELGVATSAVTFALRQPNGELSIRDVHLEEVGL